MLASLTLAARLTHRSWRLLLVGLVGVIGTSVLTLASAHLLGRGLASVPSLDWSIWGALVVVVIARSGVSFAGSMAMGRVAALAVANLRQSLYDAYIRAPVAYFDRNYSANLVSALTTDAAYIQGALESTLPTLARTVPTILFALLLLYAENWQLALWLCVAALPIAVAVVFVGRLQRNLSRNGQAYLGEMAMTAQESLTGLRLIKVLTQEAFFRRRFGRQIDRQMAVRLESVRITATFNALLPIGTTIALLGALWILQRQFAAGATTQLDLAGFAAYLGVLSLGGLEFISVYSRVEAMNGALLRVGSILKQATVEEEAMGGIDAPAGPGLVEFDDVSFRYPEGGGLDDVKLRIEPGEVVAIIGRNGSGKSTLVHVLLRYYQPQSGQVRLDGLSAERADLASWRRRFAVVSRDPVIFSLTVRENIGLGRPGATLEEIEAAARAVNLHDVIERLPGGYNARVGESGLRLSSGQRQRLALARIFLQDPSVVVFDEATNSLDAESEQAFTEALATWSGSRTIILISHQLQKFWPVTRVVRLEGGRLRDDSPTLITADTRPSSPAFAAAR